MAFRYRLWLNYGQLMVSKAKLCCAGPNYGQVMAPMAKLWLNHGAQVQVVADSWPSYALCS